MVAILGPRLLPEPACALKTFFCKFHGLLKSGRKHTFSCHLWKKGFIYLKAYSHVELPVPGRNGFVYAGILTQGIPAASRGNPLGNPETCGDAMLPILPCSWLHLGEMATCHRKRGKCRIAEVQQQAFAAGKNLWMKNEENLPGMNSMTTWEKIVWGILKTKNKVKINQHRNNN